MSTIHSSWLPVGGEGFAQIGHGEAEHRHVDGDEQDRKDQGRQAEPGLQPGPAQGVLLVMVLRRVEEL